MKVIICGGRDLIVEDERYQHILDRALVEFMTNIDEIVSGAAKGGDRIGEAWAVRHNYPIKRFPANWDALGKKAGILRNIEMARYVSSDGMVVALPGGTGTAHMKQTAHRYHLTLCTIYTIGKQKGLDYIYDYDFRS